MSDSKFLAFGRFRREIIFLGVGTQEEVTAIASAATQEGRAAETFVVSISAHFVEGRTTEASPEASPAPPPEPAAKTAKFDGKPAK